MLEASTLVLPGIRHVFATRKGGVSEGIYASLNCGIASRDARENVDRNRAIVAEAVGLGADRLVNAYQVHSPDVVTVETPWTAENRPKADALVTNRAGLGLTVSTADCTPVLFADPDASVIGAAHAGWRGALTGVLEATIDAMVRLGAERSRIRAAIGPTISGEAYEVGPDFITRFAEEDEGARRFFRPAEREGHAFFDLPRYVADRLRTAGVDGVQDLKRCTYRNEDEHFSYRRATHRGEADYGRHIAVIALG